MSSPNTSTAPVSSGAVDPRRWLALVVIAASSLMVVLDASIVNIALPHAQIGLHMHCITRNRTLGYDFRCLSYPICERLPDVLRTLRPEGGHPESALPSCVGL